MKKTPSSAKAEEDKDRAAEPEEQEVEDLEQGLSSKALVDDSKLDETHQHNSRLACILLLILFLGTCTATAVLWMGIRSERDSVADDFERSALDLVNKLSGAWEDYVAAAGVLHGQCRGSNGVNVTRKSFRQAYEYITHTTGIDVQAVQWDPRVPHSQRTFWEDEARQYYAEKFPHIAYRGFVGFNTANATTLEPRDVAEVYYPIHFMEPIIGNEAAIDLDYYASGSRKRTVQACLDHGKPALTDRLRLVQETEAIAYGVVLMHPGINLTEAIEDEWPASPDDEAWPKDLASIVIRIPDLLQRAAANQGEPADLYLYDRNADNLFLGAARITPRGDNEATLERLDEQSLTDLRSSMNSRKRRERHSFEAVIPAANKEWTVLVAAVPGSFEESHGFVIAGGCMLVVAAVALAFWIWTNTKRAQQINDMKVAADAERAALVIEKAQEATKAERELNDFIAHEVRNPVAAAMAATSFVQAALNEKQPLQSLDDLEQTRADVNIIQNALKFVNDLLRNMLDMHRAASKRMKVVLTPTDLLHDVMEPVDAMLSQRGTAVQFITECPSELCVNTDRLRLKQVMLNLGRNSAKFVQEGFIRLSAKVVRGNVELSVEDSGPGIPHEKRKLLFQKFQESLDQLSQGTGIGLHLCKNLVDLMGGEIFLDESYESGVAGCPGTRIVVRLHQQPLDPNTHHEQYINDKTGGSTSGDTEAMTDQDPYPSELPKDLNVLFVDDDPILRKLFKRTARTVAPDWHFREASNGETALKLVETEQFDLIFCDMYMASIEKQLLGTETVAALRQMGVTCRICGLSANDKEAEFLEAGADAFTFKPFPCDSKALTAELCRILYSHEDEHR